MIRVLFFISAALVIAPSAQAADIQLLPFKDHLFAYPKVLKKSGNFKLVDFKKKRDVYGRDKIPLRKVHSEYVSERVRWSRRLRKYKSRHGTYKYYEVGQKKAARITVVYLHGKGGNYRQGVNDWTFGGNFNRLQNLMVRNGGVLLTPSFTDFKNRGAEDIATLIATYKKRSPTGALMIACGSMGGGICWQLLSNPATAENLDGAFILGSHWHDDFLTSPTSKPDGRSVPLYFGHGSDDVVFKSGTQHNFYKNIRKQNPNYPARFVMFNTGVHGTPIRMVDWRRELNWMLRN